MKIKYEINNHKQLTKREKLLWKVQDLKTLNHFNMVDASTVVIDKVSKTLDGNCKKSVGNAWLEETAYGASRY